jgi:hypothetical protein
MTVDESNDIEELRQQATRLGILLPDFHRPPPTLGCFGHQLPAPFIWFCRHYPQHSGFPHYGWEPPMGLLSPFGKPSALKRWNADVRELNPGWPAHWISFWHGNDGDYCFSYDKEGHPWIVYWYYNNFNGDFEAFQFTDDYQYCSFADWFAVQVEWALARHNHPEKPRR